MTFWTKIRLGSIAVQYLPVPGVDRLKDADPGPNSRRRSESRGQIKSLKMTGGGMSRGILAQDQSAENAISTLAASCTGNPFDIVNFFCKIGLVSTFFKHILYTLDSVPLPLLRVQFRSLRPTRCF